MRSPCLDKPVGGWKGSRLLSVVELTSLIDRDNLSPGFLIDRRRRVPSFPRARVSQPLEMRAARSPTIRCSNGCRRQYGRGRNGCGLIRSPCSRVSGEGDIGDQWRVNYFKARPLRYPYLNQRSPYPLQAMR